MKRRTRNALVAAGVAVLAALPNAVGAQVPPAARTQQQIEQQQVQQLARLQEHMQRMDQVMERARLMNQEWARLMERDQLRVTEQHQLMQQMGESLGTMATMGKTLMERTRAMVQDRAVIRDQEMSRELERFQNRLGEMTENMEAMVQTMERLTERFRSMSG